MAVEHGGSDLVAGILGPSQRVCRDHRRLRRCTTGIRAAGGFSARGAEVGADAARRVRVYWQGVLSKPCHVGIQVAGRLR